MMADKIIISTKITRCANGSIGRINVTLTASVYRTYMMYNQGRNYEISWGVLNIFCLLPSGMFIHFFLLNIA